MRPVPVMSVCTLGQYGNCMWFQSSDGKRNPSSGSIIPLGDHIIVGSMLMYQLQNNCDVSATAICVSQIPHVWLPLPGVVLLCERDPGHTVRLQAFHTWGRSQDLLFSPRGAMVRAHTPPSWQHSAYKFVARVSPHVFVPFLQKPNTLFTYFTRLC